MKILALVIAAQLGPFHATLAPYVTPEGERLFTFSASLETIEHSGMGRADWLRFALGKALAAQRWCLDGWEITSRQEVSGMLAIEGRCRQETAPAAATPP